MAIDAATRTRIQAGEAAGLKLVARFKKQEYACTIGAADFTLEDGRVFKSASAAGSAVMAGQACNGWRFWTTAEQAEMAAATKAEKPAKAPKPTKGPKQPKAQATPKRRAGRPSRMIKVARSQDGVAEHCTRFFCSGCMDQFDAPTGELQTVCPNGHSDQTAA